MERIFSHENQIQKIGENIFWSKPPEIHWKDIKELSDKWQQDNANSITE